MKFKKAWVKGFEGRYKVDTNGNVFSMKKNPTTPMLTRMCKGYVKVNLVKSDGELTCTSVHRILMNTFAHKKGVERLQVNHINGIKNDNRLENLEWCTAKENISHAIKSGLFDIETKKRRMSRLGKVFSKLSPNYTNRPTYAVNQKGKVLNFNSRKEATKKTGIAGNRIAYYLKVAPKNSSGYFWFKTKEEAIARAKEMLGIKE